MTIGPRHRRPITDDLVLAVAHGTFGDSSGRSVLLSRAQVRELIDWLTLWYDNGWDGVPRVEGPTSADVVEHYRAIAVGEGIRADHERIDAHRLLNAAIALVPADSRGEDLDEIALEQGRAWVRLYKERDRLEQIRRLFVQGLVEIEYSTIDSADTLRKAARRLLNRTQIWQGEVSDAEAATAPLYDRARLVTAAQILPPRD